MSNRCMRCCQLHEQCKCITGKGRYRCQACNGLFQVGDRYYSDAPERVWHERCRLPKEAAHGIKEEKILGNNVHFVIVDEIEKEKNT